MEKMREIRDFQGLIHMMKENQDFLKKAALPVVVAVSLVVFWVFGGEDSMEITEGSEDFTDSSEPFTAEQVTDDFPGDIYVDIGGDVVNPGVYQIPAGTRLFQVIEKAGGLKETADTDSINQAEAVTDGQKIMIGSLDETSPYFTGTVYGSSGGPGASYGSEDVSSAVRVTSEGTIININRATLEELQLIPGIGPSTAQKILNFREESGGFNDISDIKKISGIGEKTFENMKEYIEV